MGLDIKDIGGDILGKVVDIGGSLVGAKYESDLQGHQIDKQNQYNKDAAIESWNRQIQENQRVFEQNVKREDEVYNREKQDAIDLWNIQNEYNSPKNQMLRLKAAGLNPRLMYGEGNVGNAIAISTPHVKGSDLESARADYTPSGLKSAPRYMEAINNYVRMRHESEMTKATSLQSQILEAQKQGIEDENNFKRYEYKTMMDAGITRYDDSRIRLGGRILDLLWGKAPGESPKPMPWKIKQNSGFLENMDENYHEINKN